MMTTTGTTIQAEQGPAVNGQRKEQYQRFFRRLVMLVLVCSVLPLLLVGWGINIHYTRFARSRITENFSNEVNHHLKVIELFLKEHSAKLQLVARTHSKAYLSHPANLNTVFETINRNHATLTDLGVIDHTGKHLSYIGPYDLMDKNYSQTFWFPEVIRSGVFISDMFMGFRKEPHFIMAVTSRRDGDPWILRATIDTEALRSLVENVRIGRTGEVYLLNEEGLYQTSPRLNGNIMEKAPAQIFAPHDGIQVRTIERFESSPGKPPTRLIVGSAWLKEPRWMLVVTQTYREAFASENHANRAVLVFLLISALSILVVAVLVSKHMLGMIRRRDDESDRLNRQLMQASKLASIGELSAGVAHEINNPLAIILTEKQLLIDAAEEVPELDPEMRKQIDDSAHQIEIQIQRCKRITHSLLRFSRRTRSVMEKVHLNVFIQEVIELMEREARANGILFNTCLSPDLPVLISDPSQLQQVLLNLITNAIDAHDGKPYGRIDIETGSSRDGQGIHLRIGDTGCGIVSENLQKIFEPFFTTKPIGKGTGLGLSICHSIVSRLGGRITVQSALGKGTQFDIYLPLRPPAALMQEN